MKIYTTPPHTAPQLVPVQPRHLPQMAAGQRQVSLLLNTKDARSTRPPTVPASSFAWTLPTNRPLFIDPIVPPPAIARARQLQRHRFLSRTSGDFADVAKQHRGGADPLSLKGQRPGDLQPGATALELQFNRARGSVPRPAGTTPTLTDGADLPPIIHVASENAEVVDSAGHGNVRKVCYADGDAVLKKVGKKEYEAFRYGRRVQVDGNVIGVAFPKVLAGNIIKPKGMLSALIGTAKGLVERNEKSWYAEILMEDVSNGFAAGSKVIDIKLSDTTQFLMNMSESPNPLRALVKSLSHAYMQHLRRHKTRGWAVIDRKDPSLDDKHGLKWRIEATTVGAQSELYMENAIREAAEKEGASDSDKLDRQLQLYAQAIDQLKRIQKAMELSEVQTVGGSILMAIGENSEGEPKVNLKFSDFDHAFSIANKVGSQLGGIDIRTKLLPGFSKSNYKKHTVASLNNLIKFFESKEKELTNEKTEAQRGRDRSDTLFSDDASRDSDNIEF